MITIDTVPSDKRELVAREVAAWLMRNLDIGRPLAPEKIDVRETISCWVLRRGFSDAPRPGEDAFEQAGYWHQVYIEQDAIFARSTIAMDDGVTVHAGGLSPTVPVIEDNLKWLHQQEALLGGDYSARLLVAAGFYLRAFWLRGERPLIVPIDAEQSRLRERLRSRTFYDVDEFVEILVGEIRRRRDDDRPPR